MYTDVRRVMNELLSAGEAGATYVLDSSCKRGSVVVRLGLCHTEKGYRWFFEVLPSKSPPVIRQGDEATVAAACACLDKYLRMSQLYLDEIVAELASFPRNPEGLN